MSKNQQPKQLMVLSGIPASGKSTFARELLKKEPGRWKRVNRDSLRAMMDENVWSPENEKLVQEAKRWIVKRALNKGYNVILDDTNLSARHYNEACKIAKEVGDVTVIHKFFHISLKEAIKRDANRARSVTPPVIGKFYKEYARKGSFKQQDPAYYPPLNQVVPKVEYDPDLEDCVVCDIDGTVALHVARTPFEFEKCDTDAPNPSVVGLMHILDKANGPALIFVSGREDSVRDKTEAWLDKHKLYHNGLYMRKTGDNRKDYVVKKEIYEDHIKGRYNVLFALDDRNQVVKFWREQGLTCLQVAEGDF